MFNLNLSAEAVQKLMDDGTFAKILEACTFAGEGCKCKKENIPDGNWTPGGGSVDDSTHQEEAKEEKPKRKPTKKTKKEADEPPFDTEETKVTLEEVQGFVRKYVRTKRDVIKDVLAKYNADKVSTLADEDLASFYKDFKEAVGE